MIIAVEDLVAEALVRRIVAEVRADLVIAVPMRLGGRSAVERKLSDLNRTARSVPVFAMIDLDRPEPCPPDIIKQHFPGGLAPLMLFRVAVFEAESWVLADCAGVAELLAVPEHRIPARPDEEPDPKRTIVNLARKSRRKDIRDDLVPAEGGTASVGPAFNARLSAFIAGEWSLQRAQERSPSLRRTVDRLAEAFR